MPDTILEFPKNFSFGSGTAAFQVEGDDRRRSTDWDIFLRSNPGIIKSDERGPEWWTHGKAEKDIEQMAGLGLKIQRIGFEWGRIEPEKGNINLEAVARYKEIIKKIIDMGMIPMVTLNHYALPEWVAKKGSWENPKIVGHFEHYVKFVVLEFPEIEYWLTLNEPNGLVLVGYLTRYYPPGKNNIFSATIARQNMIEAHKRAFRKIKSINPIAKVGMTIAFRWNMPENENNILDRWYAQVVNYFSAGSYIEATKKTLDFIGCNYYTGYYLGLNISNVKLRMRLEDRMSAKTLLFGETRRPTAYKSDYSWPIVPDFFLDLLRTLHKHFDLPIIITENGIADRQDKHRAYYIITHLVAVWKALQEGVKIEQYLHWATVDNFEWTFGYTKDFGLIKNNAFTGERSLQPSAHLYSEIARGGIINVDHLLEKYLKGEQKDRAREMIGRLLK